MKRFKAYTQEELERMKEKQEATIKLIKLRAASICAELLLRRDWGIELRDEFLQSEGKVPDGIDNDIAALEWLIKTIDKAVKEI